MVERYFPMDSQNDDRPFSSFNWRSIFSNFFENGRTNLYGTLSNSIQLSYSISNKGILLISRGSLFIDGVMYINESVKEIEIRKNASSTARTDTIVAGIDEANRLISVNVVSTPLPTDLVLGTVRVGIAGILSVTNTDRYLKIKENKITVDKIKEYTYIIDSDQALADWINGVSGNDYSKVFVAHGEYSMNAASAKTAPTTGYIYGAGSKIIFTDSVVIINGAVIDGISFENAKFTNCKISNGTYNKCVFEYCTEIFNISIFEIAYDDSFEYGHMYKCYNIKNVRVDIGQPHLASLFDNCGNISDSFISCVGHGSWIFDTCTIISNVEVLGGFPGVPNHPTYAMRGCDKISNVDIKTAPNLASVVRIQDCTGLYNCSCRLYTGCSRLYNCDGGTCSNCSQLYLCNMSEEYSNCYISENKVSANKFPVGGAGTNTANTAQFGFNLGRVSA